MTTNLVLRALGRWLLDSGPVVTVALIAGAGSFTHIRDTATQHGQSGPMAWAIAVCVDLTCVMAARERQRDKKTGRKPRGRISWPTLVLVGGILLSLAANLAQAEPSPWGWITAATPAVAFLVAVSLLERRASARPVASASSAQPAAVASPVPASSPSVPPPSSSPAPSSPSSGPVPVVLPGAAGRDETAPLPSTSRVDPGARPDRSPALVPIPGLTDGDEGEAASASAALLDYARRVADEHHARHGKPITRDLLRARLGVSNQLASELLRQLRTTTAPA
jgi:hypothetical protein